MDGYPETAETRSLKLSDLKLKNDTLDIEESWHNHLEKNHTPKEIIRLLCLPACAYRAAAYAHENNLSHNQKQNLFFLFRDETDKALGIIYTQVSLTAGNSPSDRIGYLKDFQNWQKQLVELLQKALDCINEETWTKKLKVLVIDNKALFYKDNQEWWKRMRETLLLKVKGKVFDETVYFQKFGDFTRNALKLLSLMSTMMEITMERPEWIIKALDNIGELPENTKIEMEKKRLKKHNNLQSQVEKIISKSLLEPTEKLTKLIKNLSRQELLEATTTDSGKAGDIEQQKAKSVKEPSKEATQAYKLYYGSGKNQSEVAEIMSKKLRKPVSQGQVSKWVNQYKDWAKANNIPVVEKPTIINMSFDKLDMGKRTNGKRTGEPHHKAKFDPDGEAYE